MAETVAQARSREERPHTFGRAIEPRMVEINGRVYLVEIAQVGCILDRLTISVFPTGGQGMMEA